MRGIYIGILVFSGFAAIATFGWTVATAPNAEWSRMQQTTFGQFGSTIRQSFVEHTPDESFEVVLRFKPRSERDRLTWLMFFGLAADRAGRVEQAAWAWRELKSLVDKADRSRLRAAELAYAEGWALRGLGREEDAQHAWLLCALELESAEHMPRVTAYNLACYYALAGERELALENWTIAMERDYVDLRWAQVDPDLDSIRCEPRFQAALEHRLWRARQRNTARDESGSRVTR